MSWRSFHLRCWIPLRQSIETGHAVVSRAKHRVTYPARFQLVAAMNPCRCGHLGDPDRACPRAPGCGRAYLSKVSGPLLDRFDLKIEVGAVSAADLTLPPPAEGSSELAGRVSSARRRQYLRYADETKTSRLQDGDNDASSASFASPVRTNAEADGQVLTAIASPDDGGKALLSHAADRLRFSARAYHRVCASPGPSPTWMEGRGAATPCGRGDLLLGGIRPKRAQGRPASCKDPVSGPPATGRRGPRRPRRCGVPRLWPISTPFRAGRRRSRCALRRRLHREGSRNDLPGVQIVAVVPFPRPNRHIVKGFRHVRGRSIHPGRRPFLKEHRSFGPAMPPRRSQCRSRPPECQQDASTKSFSAIVTPKLMFGAKTMGTD